MTNKEMVSVRIPKELNTKLKEYLKPLGLTKNAFILSLIQKELEKSERGA